MYIPPFGEGRGLKNTNLNGFKQRSYKRAKALEAELRYGQICTGWLKRTGLGGMTEVRQPDKGRNSEHRVKWLI